MSTRAAISEDCVYRPGGTQGVCINQQVGHTGLDKRCAGF